MLKTLTARVRSMTFLTWLLLISAVANMITAMSVASLATSRLEVYVRGGSVAVQGDVEILNGRHPVKVEVVP